MFISTKVLFVNLSSRSIGICKLYRYIKKVLFIVLVVKGKDRGCEGSWGIITEDLKNLDMYYAIRENGSSFRNKIIKRKKKILQDFHLPFISNAFKMPSESSSERIVKSERSYFFCNEIK